MNNQRQKERKKAPSRGSKPGERRGGGSRKGVPNKATANAREAIAALVEGNIEKLQGWLDQIAEQDGPKDAFRCFMEVVEYHIPKLSRQDVTARVETSLVFSPEQLRRMADEQEKG